MNKKFWIILGIIAAVILGFLLFKGGDEANAPSGSGEATSHILGNPEASVTLIEYADYQCPFCAVFHPVVKQVADKYQDDIMVQFRHLPLPSHQNARAAARAAEAAGNQDKFWEMTDLIFQNQTTWAESNSPRSLFEQYAQQLNLDIEQFSRDYESSTTNSRINADVSAFNETGTPMSTPAFFLNGQRLNLEAASVEEFSKYIDEALGRSGDN